MFRIRPDGTIECETQEELQTALRLRAQAGGAGEGDVVVLTDDTEYRRKAVAFLGFINEHRQGVTGAALVQAGRLSHPRALGPMSGWLKRFLSEHGIRLDQVVGRLRRGNERLWVPKGKIEDAIELLK